MRICCELNAKYFETSAAHKAQEYARQTGGCVYSWKTVGDSDWLEAGVWRCDVLGLLVLPVGLPDAIDLKEEGDECGHDKQYPLLSALIEGMLLDVSRWLNRWGAALRLPIFFRPGALLARRRNRCKMMSTNRVETSPDSKPFSWSESNQ